MKKSTKSTYTVSLDMKFSHQYVVEAKTAAEAKKKAFARFKVQQGIQGPPVQGWKIKEVR